MEFFKTYKLLAEFLMAYSIEKDMKSAWKFSIILCVQIFTYFGSIIYLIRHINDLSEILYPFFQAFMLICSISSFSIGVINCCEFVTLIKKIQQIYDSSMKSK